MPYDILYDTLVSYSLSQDRDGPPESLSISPSSHPSPLQTLPRVRLEIGGLVDVSLPPPVGTTKNTTATLPLDKHTKNPL